MKDVYYEYTKDRFEPLTYNRSLNNKCPAHYHKQIELFYVLSGTQKVTINSFSFEAKKGDIVYCNPFDIHEYSTKFPSMVLFIGIPTAYTSFFSSYTHSGRLAGNHLPKCKYTGKIFEVMKEFSTAKSHSFLYNYGLVNKLLGLLSEAIGIEKEHDTKSSTLIETILNYINENYRSPLSIQDIAEHCNYNKYYISRIFNSTFNCNLNNYINLRRLEALIDEKSQHPDRSTQEIAVKVGFPTERTFYRVFKSTYGCTPKEYFSSSPKNVNN